MASAPIRDQLTDHLITPQNAALEEGNSATGNRLETVPQIVEIVLTERLLKE
jgi:hypothetical protein